LTFWPPAITIDHVSREEFDTARLIDSHDIEDASQTTLPRIAFMTFSTPSTRGLFRLTRPQVRKFCAGILCCFGMLSWSHAAPAADSTDPKATPWEQAYTGNDARGPHVLGLWKFDSADGLDATGKLTKGELRHGKLVPQGKFGGALESFSGVPAVDRSHGSVVPNNPRLSPSGAFTLELWIKPKPEFESRPWSIVIDKKYAGNDDYQLSFGASDAKKLKSAILTLGFGSESQSFSSDRAAFPAGEWVHLAVTYNGKGKVRFYRNGQPFGESHAPTRGAISAGQLGLSIGDRLGSSYPGFPGFVDEVRLTSGVREFGRLRIDMHWPRRTFVRFEPSGRGRAVITNLQNIPLTDLNISVATGEAKTTETKVPSLAPGKSQEIEIPFDTSLRPDTYPIRVTARIDGPQPYRTHESFPITLVPRALPNRMPVVMWGIGGVEGVLEELPRLKKLGFTHCFGVSVDHSRQKSYEPATGVTSPNTKTAAPSRHLLLAREMLDTALANDFQILAATHPSYVEPHFHEYLQVDRNGKPHKRKSLSPNAPLLIQHFEWMGRKIAQDYADHPAFSGICVNSEVRDDSNVSFGKFDQAAHRQAFGKEIPDWVNSKYGPSYTTLKDFPKNRVVADDHPQRAFYKWWWSVGDGWNAAHTAVHRGLHTSPRKDLWTFYDPVVRVPPLWGSGGEVDVLSQWSYTDPDPLRMALTSDEVLAMAGGRQPRGRAMKMTQLFWYRSTTAPSTSSPREGESPATWVDQDPNTSFISIHPTHLREAFWTKIARPFEGIMYHGWSSLVPTDGSHAYKYTHTQLEHELTRLTREVVQPLGPTLTQIPAEKSDIAFLQSFTSAVFANRGTWGYAGGWQADLYLTLQYAHLQPDIIYEEHIQRDGLAGRKVLIMADCDVLPQSVVDRVLAFQKQGGLIVGDTNLCPAIRADIVLPVVRRTRKTAVDKPAFLKLAKTLREQLDRRYTRALDTSNPEIVAWRRRAGTSDYLFLVNDAREPGNYVGQYGFVNELGVPSAANVTLRSTGQAVYDLVRHRSIPFQRQGELLVIPVQLGPADGQLLMVTERPIANVNVAGAKSVAVGGKWQGRVTVVDAAGAPVRAVVPLHVEVLDPDGRRAERSGYYGASNGVLDLSLDIALNDLPGVWEVRVTDLAAGHRTSGYVTVTR